MPFNTNQGTEEVGKLSMFNAGLLQMKRIADLQERINLVSLNPLVINEEIGVYNYEIWITCIDSLLQEISPKLESKGKEGEKGEREKAEEVRDCVHAFLQKNSIFVEKKSINGDKKITKNTHVWNVTYKAITIYEKLIRKLLDDHKFNSPEEEDEGMF